MTDKSELKLPVVHVCLGARMTNDDGYGVRKASVWIGYAEQAREHDDDIVAEYRHVPTCETCQHFRDHHDSQLNNGSCFVRTGMQLPVRKDGSGFCDLHDQIS